MKALVGLAALLLVAGCSSSPEDPEPSAGPGSSEPVSEAVSGAESSGAESSGAPAPSLPDGVVTTDLDEGPVGLAAVGKAWWATLPDAGSVQTGDGTRVEVGRFPLRLVATPAGVWVSVIGDASIALLSTDSGEVLRTVRIRPAGSEPEGLAYDGTSLWVVDQAGDRVLELDPATGDVRGEWGTGHEPRLATSASSGVYVGDYSGGSVTRVADGRVLTRNAGSCLSPQGLAVAAGIVWVACTIDGQVVGLDAETLKPVVELPGLDSADAVVASGDTVYAVGQRGPTVWAIDAASRTVMAEVALGEELPVTENVGAALVGSSLFVSHPDVKRVYEVPLSLLR